MQLKSKVCWQELEKGYDFVLLQVKVRVDFAEIN